MNSDSSNSIQLEQVSDEIILGMWNLRGRAQVLIYLLEYCKIPYKLQVYETRCPEQWIKDKYKLGFNFPNIPYLIKGSFMLTETIALIRWIIYEGKNLDLLGKEPYEAALIETVYSNIENLGKKLTTLCSCNPMHFEELKKKEFAEMKKKFLEFEKFLGNKDWLIGYLTFVDFFLFYLMEWLVAMQQDFFCMFENLRNFFVRFEELESIKYYRQNKLIFKNFLPTGVTWSEAK